MIALRALPANRGMVLGIAALGVAIATAGLVLLRDAWFAWWGGVVEDGALRDLRKVLQEGWSLETNVPSPKGGDIDAVLRHTRTKALFAVEIKSLAGVEVEDSWVLPWAKLRWKDGRALSRRQDPFPQTLRNAQAIGAVPVLWLPRARAWRSKRKLANGVLLVQGKAKALMAAVNGQVSR